MKATKVISYILLTVAAMFITLGILSGGDGHHENPMHLTVIFLVIGISSLALAILLYNLFDIRDSIIVFVLLIVAFVYDMFPHRQGNFARFSRRVGKMYDYNGFSYTFNRLKSEFSSH